MVKEALSKDLLKLQMREKKIDYLESDKIEEPERKQSLIRGRKIIK